MALTSAERQRAFIERQKAKAVAEVAERSGADMTALRALVDRLYGERKLNMLGRRALLDWIDGN